MIKLRNYEFPSEFKPAIRGFVDDHNKERYHESVDNITPEDL
jgi:hypothetical protein